VGVGVNRFGGLGDFSSISIRGSTSEQVLVYLDGVLLNDATGGGVNLGTIPVSHIDKIEIYRGSSPVRFGEAGIGGIVSIRTRQPSKENLLSIKTQYGSFNTFRLNGLVSGKPSRWDYVMGLEYNSSENNFLFVDDNGTQFNTADDQEVERENNQFWSMNGIAKVGYDWSQETRLNVHAKLLRTYKGVPGINRFQSLDANFRTSEVHSGIELAKRRVFGSSINLNWKYNYGLKIEAFRDLKGEIGVGNQDNENRTEKHEGLINLGLILGSHQRIEGTARVSIERFKPFDHLQQEQLSSSHRRTASFGFEDQMMFMGDRLLIVPSLLYDLVDNSFNGQNFITGIGRDVPLPGDQGFLTRQIGTLYRLTDHLEFRANIGRYFRPPNLFELFGDKGGVVGNAELLPENGLNRDTGFKYTGRFESFVKGLQVQATYFHNDVENLILFIQTSQRTSKAENIGKARIQGQELMAVAEVRSWLTIRGNYTHQRAVNRSDIPSQRGKFLPGRPVHKIFGEVELSSNLGSFFYSYDFTDQNFLDSANQIPTRSRSIHNMGISATPWKNKTITLEVKNLTDSRIEDIYGFPLPGRSIFLSIQGRI
jgi:iron complex outermembrane receptor protein